jgi:hypothetical protein
MRKRSDTATIRHCDDPTLNLNLNFSFRLGLEARRIQGSGSIERKTV